MKTDFVHHALWLIALCVIGLVRIQAQTSEGPRGIPVKIWGSAVATGSAGEPADLELSGDFLERYPGAADGSFLVFGSHSGAGGFVTARSEARLEVGRSYPLGISASLVNKVAINLVPPPGYRMEIDGMVRTRLEFSVSGSHTTPKIIRVLPPTGSAAGRAGTASSITSGRIYWQVSLGNLSNGASALPLAIIDAGTASSWSNLFTPAGLQYEAPSAEVYVHRDVKGIRQIIADEAAVDVSIVSPTCYELRFYDPTTQMTGSAYPRTFQGEPFVTYRIEQGDTATELKITSLTRNLASPSATGNPIVRRVVTVLTRTGSSPAFSWLLKDWTTDQQSVLSEKARNASVTANDRTETLLVRAPDGIAASQNSIVFGLKPWGEEPVSRTCGSTSSVTTTFDYHVDPGQPGSYAQLKSRTTTGGAWEAFEYYDATGDNAKATGTIRYRFRPFGSLPATTTFDPNQGECTHYEYDLDPFGMLTRPTLTETKVNMKTTAKSLVSYSAPAVVNGMNVVTADRTDFSSANRNLRTITKYYSEDTSDAFFRRQVHSIQLPDGTKTSMAYQRGAWIGGTFTPSANGGTDPGPASRIAMIRGTSSTGSPFTNYFGYDIDDLFLVEKKSTMEVTIRDARAHLVRTETHVWSGGSWVIISSSDSEFDLAGNLISRVASSGAKFTAVYDGELKASEISPTGVKTSYVYDAAGRVSVATKAGAGAIGPLATRFVYDADDRVLQKIVGDGQAETLTSSRVFDDAGRLKFESDPGPNGPMTTSYSYFPEYRKVIVSPASGGSRTELYRMDGMLVQVEGSAVIPQFFTDDVDGDGMRYRRVNVAAFDSARLQESKVDWLGRPILNSRPRFGSQLANEVKNDYDDLGRLQKVSSSGYASTLYEYDVMAQPLRSGLDLNNNSVLDNGLSDRISESEHSFELYNGAWWDVQETRTYPKSDSASRLITGSTRQRLTGFTGGVQAETVSIDVYGNVSTRTVTVNREDKTVSVATAKTGYANAQVELLLNDLPVTTTGFDGLVQTVGYDSLQRRSSVSLPRTGVTTTSYRPGSTFVAYVRDAVSPTPNTVSSYAYDNAGRVTAVFDAAGHVERTEYDVLGRVVRRWGDGCSPVEFSYNQFGERISMKTYRGGAGWEGTAWPIVPGTADTTTWTYDLPTGLLVAKTDAANRAVSYTYNLRGQTVTRTWARGTRTTYQYDEATGELIGQSYSDGTPSVLYNYARSGQRLDVTDVTGNQAFVYNSDNPLQLDAVSLPAYFGNRVLARYYDSLHRPAGFLLSNVGNLGTEITQTYTYNSLGRFDHLTSGAAGQATRDFTYGYNSGGLVSSVSVSDAPFAVTREYEPNRDLLTSMESKWGGGVKTRYEYTYNALGQRTTAKQSGEAYADFGSSTFHRYAYNSRGEVTEAVDYLGEDVSNAGAPGLSGRHHAYSYDKAGNRLTSSRTGFGGTVDNYTANALNQYDSRENNVAHVAGTAQASASVTVSGGAVVSLLGRQGRYWDAQVVLNNTNGPVLANLSIKATLVGQGTGGVDLVREENRRAFLAKALQRFTYDADGNLTEDGVWNYTYDCENRLVSIETVAAAIPLLGVANARRLEFRYDYLNRRVEKRVLTGWNGSGYATLASERRYLYDGWNVVAELTPSDAKILWSYTWGIDVAGSLGAAGGVGALLQITDHQGPARYFPAYDGNGNVASLVRASDGAVAARYEYTPFGELLRCEGAAARDNPFRFSTKFTDDDTGLVYYGLRYYSPSQGRFINRDSIEELGGLNLYGFCGNNSVNKWDYLGMEVTHDAEISQYLRGDNTGIDFTKWSEDDWAHFRYYDDQRGVQSAYDAASSGLDAHERFLSGESGMPSDAMNTGILLSDAQEMVGDQAKLHVGDIITIDTGSGLLMGLNGAFTSSRAGIAYAGRMTVLGIESATVDNVGFTAADYAHAAAMGAIWDRYNAQVAAADRLYRAQQASNNRSAVNVLGFYAAVGETVANAAVCFLPAGPAGPVLGSLDRFTLTGLTKAAARQAVNEMGLAGAQSEAAISAVSRATRQSVVNVSQYGSDVVVQVMRSGRDGYQVMETIVNLDGKKIVLQRAYNAAGEVIHYHPKGGG